MKRLLAVTFFLIWGCGISSAQPAARMVDEFSTKKSTCEFVLAGFDAYFKDLSNDPSATGLIVIYGDADDSRAADHIELVVQNAFALRRLPHDRVTIVRGVARPNGATQFWLIPAGASRPQIELAELTVKQRSTEPDLYAADYPDGIAGCTGRLYDLGEYARELNSLPSSRGRIVIGESSRAKFRAKLAAITVALAANGIPRSRFTAIYKYVRPNRLLEVTELWVVP